MVVSSINRNNHDNRGSRNIKSTRDRKSSRNIKSSRNTKSSRDIKRSSNRENTIDDESSNTKRSSNRENTIDDESSNTKRKRTSNIKRTSRFLSKYELAYILGQRAVDIAAGSPPFIDLNTLYRRESTEEASQYQRHVKPKKEKRLIDPLEIARSELYSRQLDHWIICRQMPNGEVEEVKLRDLQFRKIGEITLYNK
jgi:DNA-directed RNA polymerase subunit K/omega